MPKGLTTLLCRLCGCGINHQDNLTLLLLCSWTLIYLPYSSLPQRLRSDATNTKVPSGTWISYMQFANTEEKDRRQKGNPPHKCPQVTGLQIWHWLIYLPSAPAQKRVQQLKSNERRSNKNKRTASDVGSKDDQIVTQEVIRSMTGETPGLRRHVGGKKNKTIFFIKTFVEKRPFAKLLLLITWSALKALLLDFHVCQGWPQQGNTPHPSQTRPTAAGSSSCGSITSYFTGK